MMRYSNKTAMATAVRGLNPSTCPVVIALISVANSQAYLLPLYVSSVSAGFPSPAEDHLEAKLDLNELLVKRPAATFFLRARGDAMLNAGIHPGDIMVVDRSIKAADGKIIVAAIDGRLTARRLYITKQGIFLAPENVEFSAIEITPENDFYVWGVVTHVIHAV